MLLNPRHTLTLHLGGVIVILEMKKVKPDDVSPMSKPQKYSAVHLDCSYRVTLVPQKGEKRIIIEWI